MWFFLCFPISTVIIFFCGCSSCLMHATPFRASTFSYFSVKMTLLLSERKDLSPCALLLSESYGGVDSPIWVLVSLAFDRRWDPDLRLWILTLIWLRWLAVKFYCLLDPTIVLTVLGCYWLLLARFVWGTPVYCGLSSLFRIRVNARVSRFDGFSNTTSTFISFALISGSFFSSCRRLFLNLSIGDDVCSD